MPDTSGGNKFRKNIAQNLREQIHVGINLNIKYPISTQDSSKEEFSVPLVIRAIDETPIHLIPHLPAVASCHYQKSDWGTSWQRIAFEVPRLAAVRDQHDFAEAYLYLGGPGFIEMTNEHSIQVANICEKHRVKLPPTLQNDGSSQILHPQLSLEDI